MIGDFGESEAVSCREALVSRGSAEEPTSEFSDVFCSGISTRQLLSSSSSSFSVISSSALNWPSRSREAESWAWCAVALMVVDIRFNR